MCVRWSWAWCRGVQKLDHAARSYSLMSPPRSVRRATLPRAPIGCDVAPPRPAGGLKYDVPFPVRYDRAPSAAHLVCGRPAGKAEQPAQHEIKESEEHGFVALEPTMAILRKLVKAIDQRFVCPSGE